MSELHISAEVNIIKFCINKLRDSGGLLTKAAIAILPCLAVSITGRGLCPCGSGLCLQCLVLSLAWSGCSVTVDCFSSGAVRSILDLSEEGSPVDLSIPQRQRD